MFDTITVRGFAATRPDLRTLPDGTPVSSFRLASTPRRFDAATSTWVDVGPTNWYTVSCFRRIAGNAASSIRVGDAVIVMGRLRQRPWTTHDGVERLAVEIDASSLGPDLALGTATYRRSAGAHVQEETREEDRCRSTDPGQPADDEEAELAGAKDAWEGDGPAVDPATGEVLDRGREDQRDAVETDDEESSWEGDAADLLDDAGTSQRSAARA